MNDLPSVFSACFSWTESSKAVYFRSFQSIAPPVRKVTHSIDSNHSFLSLQSQLTVYSSLTSFITLTCSLHFLHSIQFTHFHTQPSPFFSLIIIKKSKSHQNEEHLNDLPVVLLSSTTMTSNKRSGGVRVNTLITVLRRTERASLWVQMTTLTGPTLPRSVETWRGHLHEQRTRHLT